MEYINLQQCMNLVIIVKSCLAVFIAVVTIAIMYYVATLPSEIKKKDKEVEE